MFKFLWSQHVLQFEGKLITLIFGFFRWLILTFWQAHETFVWRSGAVKCIAFEQVSNTNTMTNTNTKAHESILWGSKAWQCTMRAPLYIWTLSHEWHIIEKFSMKMCIFLSCVMHCTLFNVQCTMCNVYIMYFEVCSPLTIFRLQWHDCLCICLFLNLYLCNVYTVYFKVFSPAIGLQWHDCLLGNIGAGAVWLTSNWPFDWQPGLKLSEPWFPPLVSPFKYHPLSSFFYKYKYRYRCSQA